MKTLLVFIFAIFLTRADSQELYVFSEPASNMPAHSISVKQTFKGLTNKYTGTNDARHTAEVMFGVNKNLMLHGSTSLSDMYSPNLRWESARVYAKYRFLSKDGLYSHFRMAAYAEGSFSNNKPVFDELSLDGDQSGAGAGIIATQLLHKLAISSTVGVKAVSQAYTTPGSALNYSLSAGYLILPRVYKDYNQTNLNLYVELLGENTLDRSRHYIDLAPAAQLIFNSQAKLNVGYRFQLDGNMYRMAEKSWLISFEWLFLNAL